MFCRREALVGEFWEGHQSFAGHFGHIPEQDVRATRFID
jgi:hypothetical protein